MTRETLDDLPVGTVVLDRFGFAWQKVNSESRWRRAEGLIMGDSQYLIDHFGPVADVLLTFAQADAQTADAVRKARASALRETADDIEPYCAEGHENCTSERHRMTPMVDAKWLRARADREEGRA